MIKKTMKVNGMTCAMCAKTITNTFDYYDGISAKVNVSAGKVLFTYDEDKYSFIDIAKMVEEVGYEPVLEESLNDNKKYRQKMKREIIVSVLFSIPLLWAMFGHLEAFSFVYVPSILMNGVVQLILAGVVQFYIGKRFFLGAYHSIQKKSMGMDILVVLGTTSAYLYSVYLLIIQLYINPVMHPMYYFEISALIITMVLIGNYIEHFAKEKTTDALVELMNLGAKEARVLRDNQEVMIKIEEVKLGDHIIVLANEKIPTDGIILSGITYIDEAMITGESIPVSKQKTDTVIGATLNIGEKIIIEATKVGSDTLLSQIIQTVEEASSEKPPIQRTADKIASWFVPGVVTIAIINLLIHFFILQDPFSYSFTTTVAILVISCPCALGLATPTSILVGNGKAAQNQILYKGGEFFEMANKIEAIAFDKTGTLTIGKPIVTDYVGNKDILSDLYYIEKESTHPISKAVVEYAKDFVKETKTVTNYEVIKGKGIQAQIEGIQYYIGNKKGLEELNIINPYETEYSALLHEAKTVNFVVKDLTVEAIYAVRDELKETSKLVIAAMKERGITPYMITGDNEVVASVIASELGIEHYYSEVLPHEKALIIKQIQEEKVVAFVGDGINDAPALKLADVGFAMGFGTDIAIDSSDVTIMSHDLSKVLQAIDLSKATLKNIYQNFGWAFSYNIVAIPLAATGNLSMAVAAVAMAFSSIMVVLNALRLKAYKWNEIKIEKGDLPMTLKVTNMTCGHCKMTVEKALKEKGFTGVEVNLDTKDVSFELNDLSVEDAVEAITKKGYDVEL